jgi:hypothetical protein
MRLFTVFSLAETISAISRKGNPACSRKMKISRWSAGSEKSAFSRMGRSRSLSAARSGAGPGSARPSAIVAPPSTGSASRLSVLRKRSRRARSAQRFRAMAYIQDWKRERCSQAWAPFTIRRKVSCARSSAFSRSPTMRTRNV